MRQLFHTPEGVRDVYGTECAKKLYLQRKMEKIFHAYGYQSIETPTFEFFDVFGKQVGTTPSRELYKFFDREGNTLVLRPDFTPSIARAASMYYHQEDMPIRLCYSGNTFVNRSSYQGRLKECTQLGAELLGDPSVDADAEMISMVISCLKAAGLKEFQLSIGHADFFRGLMEAAGLLEEQEEELRELISNKNFFGVEEFVETLNLEENLKNLFGMLGNLYTGSDELSAARECAASYPRILKAIGDLEELHKILEVYEVSRYVSFELGTISNYQYYTGIIFAGYTFGSGEAIVKGGRYDRLLTCFGKDSASIGFAFVIDQLMAALQRQKIDVPVERCVELMVYKSAKRQTAITAAATARAAGRCVELMLWDETKQRKDYEDYAARSRMTNVQFFA